MGEMADWQLEQWGAPIEDGDYTEFEIRCATECGFYVGSNTRWCLFDDVVEERCPYYKKDKIG